MKKLMILDGNSIVNRAFYAIRLLTNSDGVYTNAIYGFLNILLKYTSEEQPEGLCVAFDLPGPTFRHVQYDQYKAQRKGMPDELASQMPLLKQVLSAMNIPLLSVQGYEADDIIGTVARVCEEQQTECVILTGDKDDLQLASPHTRIKLIITKGGTSETTDYLPQTVMEKYGVTPQQFIDVKGLMGDPSDNIPGVAGIGEKTALSLIQQFQSIESLYEQLSDAKLTASVRTKLEAGKDQAFLSRQLATIDCNVPLTFDPQQCIRQDYNEEELLPLLRSLDLNALIKRLNLTPQEQQVSVTTDHTAFAANVARAGQMYFVLGEDQGAVATCPQDITLLPLPQLYPYLTDAAIGKIGHNLKEDIVRLQAQDIHLENIVFDTMIAAYVVDPARAAYPIEELGAQYGNITVGDTLQSKLLAILQLHPLFDEKITACGQQGLFYEVELPLITVLADMQIDGIAVDRQMLLAFGTMLGQRIDGLTEQIYQHADGPFNINSPKQLGEILFHKLQLPVIKKTKSGYSTNVEVLEKLKDSHPIIQCIMEYRQLTKLKGTYADGLLAVIHPQTGRVHSNFNQTVTVTGRISSTEPNMQNIPTRTELGREIRKMFVAKNSDYVLMDADYSQIELRVLAHIADDAAMKAAFLEGVDIHTRTAAQVFGVAEADMTPLLRSRAKAVNFGIVYGIGDFSLSQDLGITRREAKQYIDNYLERFSGVRQYMKDTVDRATRDGYTTTLLGRRRYLPELTSGNFITRAFGERVAMNTPIQGTAADIIKIAMVRVHRRLKEQGLRSRLILQVHDELIIEAHKDEIPQVSEILKYEMEHAMDLTVPLEAEVHTGATWYDAK